MAVFCLFPLARCRSGIADPLFALVITPGVYLHHVDVADQDPASGSLNANLPNGVSRCRTAGCSAV